jgi:hypothetical protein
MLQRSHGPSDAENKRQKETKTQIAAKYAKILFSSLYILLHD